jgi:hypothetical protein
MSPKRDKTVSNLVEKYTSSNPELKRPIIRRIIIGENPQIFKQNLSNIRKLDRHLRKAFRDKSKTQTTCLPLKGQWRTRPALKYDVTQNVLLPNLKLSGVKRRLPHVGFYIFNPNEYPIKVRLEVRVILGGKNLGLIKDNKGYYNGKTDMPFEPNAGLYNGNFS